MFMSIVGKASFKPEQLEENARAVIEAVAKARPEQRQGHLHLFLHAVGDDESAGARGHP
jgi:ribosomal protein L1